MDVPKPLTPYEGPLPGSRLTPEALDGPPDPEEFDAAVARCAAAGAGTDGAVWWSGLESIAAGRAALLAAPGPAWVTFRCDREGRTPAGTDVLALPL